MPIVQSKTHKQINGHVQGKPYSVLFDSDGYSTEEVPDEVAQQLVKIKAASIVPDVTSDAAVDLDKLNVPQLKSYAKKNEIDYGTANTKTELLGIIRSAQSDGTVEQPPADPNDTTPAGGNGV